MKTTEMLAAKLSDAEMVLNVDGTGGQLDPNGKPLYLTWTGAEKTYADFQLTVTSPGGTTAAGLRELEKGGIRHALAEAVEAAKRRSSQLGITSG